MSERQCHLPCGVSDSWRTHHLQTLLRQRENFIPEEANMTMREASLDTTFFGGLGGSVLNIKSTPLAACVCDEENLLAAARRVEAQRHIILRSESRRRSIVWYLFAGIIGTASKPAYWQSVTESRNRRCNRAWHTSADCERLTLATINVMYL